MQQLLVALQLLVTQVVPIPPPHTYTPHIHMSKEDPCLLIFVQPRSQVSSSGATLHFSNSAQVAWPCAIAGPNDAGGVATLHTPGLAPPGLAGMLAPAPAGDDDDPPQKKWKGVLAELFYMCSGAVLLCVFCFLVALHLQ